MMKDKYTILADSSQIVKPVVDDRSYRLFKLNDNDLSVLVINDPTTDKSAASLDVNVGSFSDNHYGISGLAHFCEHLLFMGTGKYPEENEYSSYLSHHSGHSNAYTSSEHTNYYFQLSSDYLEGALDRFAQFFIDPLFSESCKDREINAVDSENKKNLQNDLWRLYQLDKLNSNPAHPYNSFSTGNFETLHTDPLARGLDVRKVLMDFHREHYSANLMSLVILGKEDLDTLTKWAIEMFSSIPNKALSRPSYPDTIVLPPDCLGKLTKAKPVMDNHTLELKFMVPDDLELKWNSKPASYYSHLIGHESEGSILFYLKQKGWVTDLSAGNMKVCQGNSFFMLSFELTPTGLDNWKHIVVSVFQYLQYLHVQGPQKWIWEELANIAEVNFRFKQKSDASTTVSKLSNSLYKFTEDGDIPPQFVLSSSIPQTYDELAILDYGKFLSPDNFTVTLVSQSLNGLDKKEKWYGTEYSYDTIPADLMTDIKNAQMISQLHFPNPNLFIPRDFNVLQTKSKSPLTHPYLIEDTNRMQVWFKQDDQFEVPKGVIELVFHLPNSNSDVRSATFTALIAELVNDELNLITYSASLVGLKANLSFWRDGFSLKVSGYNDKLSVLMEQIVEKLVNFEPSKERFESVLFKFNKDLKNFGYNVPYNQVGTHLLILINDKTYTFEDKLKVLQDVSYDDVYSFATTTLWDAGVYIEALIQGNFDIIKAREIKDSILTHTDKIQIIDKESSKIQEIIRLKNHILAPNEIVRYELPLDDEKNINSCIEYYIQVSGDRNHERLRVLTDLVGTVVKEPCFNQLRTKEQLGYVVFSGLRNCRNSFGFRILIQSERNTYFLEYRIEEFLAKMGRYVNNELSDDEFAKFKQALKSIKLTKIKHLNEEVSRFWDSISDGYYDFESRTNHVEVLETITKQEFIQFFNDVILNKAQESSRLIVHLQSKAVPEVSLEKHIQSSVVNFSYRHDLQLDLDSISSIIKEEKELSTIIKRIVAQITNFGDFNKETISQELQQTIEKDIESPIPKGYPHGKLYTEIGEFRLHHELGGAPSPVKPLSTFYYPDSSHL
jgi:insulysin